uniref:Nucleoside diphosphate kinase n=1 Tax=Elaeis guineensis var. tenera TaxID=51953 RepID=A0A6I9RE71_ELAGV|nr:uncharacterized protein LOC105047333 isoform X2 [Elaeis guineensis]
MDDIYGQIEVFPEHFQATKASDDCLQTRNSVTDCSLRPHSHSWAVGRVMRAASLLNFFSLPRLPWSSGSDDDDKIVLTKTEVESLRSEITDAEEREAYLKAQLEHLDELLRLARLSGYLYIRTRWTQLPGEPPVIDDEEVDDWLPRFVVLQGSCIFYYLKSTDLSPQDSTLLSDVVEVGSLPPQDSTLDVVEVGSQPSLKQEDEQKRYAFYVLTCHGLRFECSSASKIQVDSWLAALRADCKFESEYRSASRTVRALLSASRRSPLLSEGRTVAAATITTLGGKVLSVPSFYERVDYKNSAGGWISGVLAVPAAAYMLQGQEVSAAEPERTFIAIKPDGVQRGLIAEILSRFERKGYKLVAIKLVLPSKEFAQKHYHDLKDRPFFDGLCDFLSSGPVLAMVWEGEGVIKYGRKLIGATDPQKSEPGTIRGDLAVVVGRNIIHGSDGPETAKDEIALWFEPTELVSYTSNAEKWLYGVN